jgi:hypothetical protein
MVLAGGPYSTHVQAEDAGIRARHALIRYAVQSRVAIDLGQNRATGGLSDYAKKEIAQHTGVQVLNDVHGLLVYAGKEHTRFIRGNRMSLTLGRPYEEFAELFTREFVRNFRLTEKQDIAFELFSASQFELSTKSRFLTLVMAVEALLAPIDREDEVCRHVGALIDQTENSSLPMAEKQSLTSSLNWLYKESIGKTGRRLAADLLGTEKYANVPAPAFFTMCYSLRSQLVHNGSITDKSVNLDSLVGEVERFVADLLSHSIQPESA